MERLKTAVNQHIAMGNGAVTAIPAQAVILAIPAHLPAVPAIAQHVAIKSYITEHLRTVATRRKAVQNGHARHIQANSVIPDTMAPLTEIPQTVQPVLKARTNTPRALTAVANGLARV